MTQKQLQLTKDVCMEVLAIMAAMVATALVAMALEVIMEVTMEMATILLTMAVIMVMTDTMNKTSTLEVDAHHLHETCLLRGRGGVADEASFWFQWE